MDFAEEIVKHARHCVLPKLSRNVEEIDNHPEYYDQNNIELHFPPVIEMISKEDLREHPEFTKVIMPALLELYLERFCLSPWNDDKCKQYAQNFNTSFQRIYQVPLDDIFQNSDFCNIQEVFDYMMKDINMKCTSQDFKKFPGIIVSYCYLMRNLKYFKIEHNPITIFPLTLLLMEDYVYSHKIRGLRCCSAILDCLEEKHFENGNYFDVIFSTFKRIMFEKKLDITKLVHECLLKFIKVVPSHAKEAITDKIFGNVLEQIFEESNLRRKTACFSFTTKIMKIHKFNCVNKRLLNAILCDNVNLCCNDAIADILLEDVIQTLQVWITHCWCVWRLTTDFELLSGLIKLLYVSRKEKIASEIQELIVTLTLICPKEQQNIVLTNLKKSEIASPEFREKIEEIKKHIPE